MALDKYLIENHVSLKLFYLGQLSIVYVQQQNKSARQIWCYM